MVDPPYLSCPDLVLPLFFPLFSTHFPYSPQKQWAALNMYLWKLWALIWRKKTRLKVLVPFIGRKMLCIKCLLQVNKERLMHLISNAYYIMVLTLLIIVPPHFPEFLKFLSILICIKTIQGLSMHAFKTLYPFTILLPLFDFNLFELNFTFICK